MTYITIWIRRLPLAVQASLRAASAVCGLRVFAWPTVPAGPYPDRVTELPIDDAAGLASAVHDAAERGRGVARPAGRGRGVAALVAARVAAAGTAAIEALEDAADLAAGEEALAEWDADDRRTYRLADVDAELSES